jgi:hypothetical protein
MAIDIFKFARTCCICERKYETLLRVELRHGFTLLRAEFQHGFFPFVFHSFRYYHEECLLKFIRNPVFGISSNLYRDNIAAKAVTLIPSYEEILIKRAEQKLMCDNAANFISRLNSSASQKNINYAKSHKTKYKKLNKNDKEVKSKFDSIFNEKE